MRTLNKNKQLMSYALYNEQIPVYETDGNGDIIYDIIDGVEIPIETGETKLGYSEAIPFKANISMSGGESEAKEFGLSVEDYNAIVVCDKGEYPITEGALIWHESEVGGPNTADYIVKKVHRSLNLVKYILKARDK